MLLQEFFNNAFMCEWMACLPKVQILYCLEMFNSCIEWASIIKFYQEVEGKGRLKLAK